MPSEHARMCAQKGHNSRACAKICGGGFKLFGVQIDVAGGDSTGESSIRKSKSLGNLQTCNPENIAAVEPSGYQSDGLIHQSSKSHDRKKGRPWSEEEHRSFLVGLEKLGKGDWKGIANQYVPTRNSSQVASHAQKINHLKVHNPITPRVRRHWAASSMNIGELKGPASIGPPVTSAERPPLSPIRRHGVPDFHSMLYAPRVSNLSQGYATHAIRPTVAWVPFVTYSNPGNVFLPNIHGTLVPSCANFVAPPSVSRLPQKGSSQTGGVAQATNDELNLNIRKLTL
ncbi:transcription factor myb1r1 [Phtheirospermum japonicum]|uniref:Transcription factor myb1r1 n=1 Tax=Phtheirospermum japonicum TaxID=374723 RepID=A0A830D3Q5_9LAMI|nr:transcription factor myb1r1 [Phtheirospermum japonicum]